MTELTEPEERSQICERLLQALPEWFGLENAIEASARETAFLPMLAVSTGAAVDGFLSSKLHDRTQPRSTSWPFDERCAGRGSAGISSQKPSTSSAFATSACGFRPPEETDAAWGESNPCLILVKRIAV